MELLNSIVGTVVRRALTGVFVWLAANGWITEQDYTALLGWLAAAVAVLVVSIVNKVKSTQAYHDLIQKALALPAGSSVGDLIEKE